MCIGHVVERCLKGSKVLTSVLLSSHSTVVLETISGEIRRVTFENEETSFRVVKVELGNRRTLTAVGRFQFVAPGTSVRISGERVRDPQHGEQFRVHSLMPIEPKTLEGIQRYLGSGMIPGIGAKYAERIVATFGLATLSVLDEEPDRLSEVQGIGKARCATIAARWSEQRMQGNLLMLLQSLGISLHLARRIQETYGERAAAVVQTEPYRLAMEMRGIGFRTADAAAAKAGLSKQDPERAQAGVLHVLREWADAGNTCIKREELVRQSTEVLGTDVPLVEAAVDTLWAGERIVVALKPNVTNGVRAEDNPDVALYTLHAAEVRTAEHLLRLLRKECKPLAKVEERIVAFENAQSIELAPEQREALRVAAGNQVSVITGGPGVGKTTIVRGVLALFAESKLSVRLAAPTGRAAKRLTETTGNKAVTLHRLLEYEPQKRGFARCEANPIDADALVVDETSMIDVSLASALLSALESGTRLVLVGDADQLPSVGPGAVLRDVISSDRLPVVKLRQVFRQANRSEIVACAHGILNGQVPRSVTPAADSDLFVIDRRDAQKAAATVVELVSRRIPSRFGFDAIKDIQVLSPMHKGPLGTQRLNQLLQQSLNPEGEAVERRGMLFRQGDRVMQLKNHYEKDVFNGDLGIVVEVDADEQTLVILFDGRQVSYSGAELDSLTHAYASSVHKSQGSEYPAVVIPLMTSHFVMLSRNLIYTAVTRAKQLCVLVGDPKAISLAVDRVTSEQRQTRLAHFLRGGS